MLVSRQQDGSTIGRKLVENEKHGDGFVVSGGWNHAHCKLCWETISTHEGYKHFGYTDGSDWVCQDCYEKYIQSCFGKKLGEAC
jgi:hypothetical protein